MLQHIANGANPTEPDKITVNKREFVILNHVSVRAGGCRIANCYKA